MVEPTMPRSKRKGLAGMACVAALVVAASAAVVLLEVVGVTMARGSDVDSARKVLDTAPVEHGEERANDALWKAGAKRAYAVVFADVHDALVLERAWALWNSLEAFAEEGSHVVALVPRYAALELEAPLRAIGYRVLPRDSPAPAWRATGRFVQQALAAIWGNGSRGGGKWGWSVLVLEALSLTEYEEVIVLDQKMILIPTTEPAPSSVDGSSVQGDDTGWIARRADSHRPSPPRAGGDGLGMGGSGLGLGLASARGTLPLLPETDDWTVAFAAGDITSLSPGEGLDALPASLLSLASGWHAGLVAVRPNARLYDAVSERLCKGDDILKEAYPDLPDETAMVDVVARHRTALAREAMLQSRAPTAPLLHLAAEFLTGANSSRLPLEICGGGGSGGIELPGLARRHSAGINQPSMPPIVWCPQELLVHDKNKNLTPGGEEKGRGHDNNGPSAAGRKLWHPHHPGGSSRSSLASGVSTEVVDRSGHSWKDKEAAVFPPADRPGARGGSGGDPAWRGRGEQGYSNGVVFRPSEPYGTAGGYRRMGRGEGGRGDGLERYSRRRLSLSAGDTRLRMGDTERRYGNGGDRARGLGDKSLRQGQGRWRRRYVEGRDPPRRTSASQKQQRTKQPPLGRRDRAVHGKSSSPGENAAVPSFAQPASTAGAGAGETGRGGTGVVDVEFHAGTTAGSVRDTSNEPETHRPDFPTGSAITRASYYKRASEEDEREEDEEDMAYDEHEPRLAADGTAQETVRLGSEFGGGKQRRRRGRRRELSARGEGEGLGRRQDEESGRPTGDGLEDRREEGDDEEEGAHHGGDEKRLGSRRLETTDGDAQESSKTSLPPANGGEGAGETGSNQDDETFPVLNYRRIGTAVHWVGDSDLISSLGNDFVGEKGEETLQRSGYRPDSEEGRERQEDGETEYQEGQGSGTSEVEALGAEGGPRQAPPAVKLAWIPGDPCACVGSPGVVGEACRGWLRARVPSLRGGVEISDDPLSACEDGALASPRRPPPPAPSVAQALAIAAATAGAAAVPAGGTGDARDGEASTEAPPPIWREHMPSKKAVVTQRDIGNFQHFWLVNEEKKLLMVAIPKVACTQVHALFLRLQHSKGWNTSILTEIHFHSEQHKYTLKTMKGMTAEKATDILNDPTWTKAVFLRDPAERLLSCFLDKIVQRRSYSVNIFKANDVLNFETFVSLLSKNARQRLGKTFPGGQLGLYRTSNPHWKPQTFFGLDKFLPYFTFIGDFNHVEAHSKALLQRTGLWEEFGASGWGPSGNNAFFQRSTVRGHSTGSHGSRSLYLTPPLLASVREAYGPTDYRMLAQLGWWNETFVGLVESRVAAGGD